VIQATPLLLAARAPTLIACTGLTDSARLNGITVA